MADVDEEHLSDLSSDLRLRVQVRKLPRVVQEHVDVHVQLERHVQDLEVSKPGRQVEGEAAAVDQVELGLPVFVDEGHDGLAEMSCRVF